MSLHVLVIQVESLFSELSKAIPCGFMTQDFSNAAEASTDKSVHSAANLSPEQLEVCQMHHQLDF